MTKLSTSMVASPPLSSTSAWQIKRGFLCFLLRMDLPAGLSEVLGDGGTLAWYLGPTRVAARGKIRSSGSVSKVSKCSARAVPLRNHTHRAYLPQTCTTCITSCFSAPLISAGSSVRSDSPKVPEGPHLEVLDLHVLLFLSQHTVFPRPSAPSRGRRVRLWLRRYRRQMPHFVPFHFFLVCARTRRTRPPIPSARLREHRRIDALHVEELLAPVALQRLRAGDGDGISRGQQDDRCLLRTVGTTSHTYHRAVDRRCSPERPLSRQLCIRSVR